MTARADPSPSTMGSNGPVPRSGSTCTPVPLDPLLMVHDISYSLLAGQRRVLGEGEHAPRRSDPPLEPAYARLGRLPRSAYLLRPDAPDEPDRLPADRDLAAYRNPPRWAHARHRRRPGRGLTAPGKACPPGRRRRRVRPLQGLGCDQAGAH